MARILKILASVMGIFIILIILAGLILPRIIDVNDYKDRISVEIEKATGFEVVMEGDIELSVFPWLGLSLGHTYVANPPEFEDTPMASLQELQVRIKLWPLFIGRVQADRVVLNGFNLDLIIDEQGRENWAVQRVRDPALPDQGQDQPEEAPQTEAGTLVLPEIDIDGLTIAEANISYQDRQKNQVVRVRNLHLNTGRISLDNPFDVSGSLNFEGIDPDLTAALQFSTQTLLDTRNEIVQLNGLSLAVDATGQILPREIKDASLNADLIYEIAGNALRLDNLELNILDARITGQAAVLDLDGTMDVRFDIQGRDLDLDKILALDQAGTDQASAREQTAQNTQAGSSSNDPFNLSFLHDFKIQGTAGFERIKVANIRVDEAGADIRSGNGQMTLEPLTASLYQGTYQGLINLQDSGGGALVLNTSQSLENMQVGPFLRDLTDNDLLSGTAMIQSDVRSTGRNSDSLVKNLSGKARFSVDDGAIKGVDLEKMIREVFALAAGQIDSTSEQEGETEFTNLGATFDITSGIAVSRDLSMSSPVLGLLGDMTLDLPESSLDSRSRISLDGALKEELSSRYNLREVTIPLRVRGPFDNLSFGLDTETIIKSFVQERGQEVIRDLLDRVAPQEEAGENGQAEDPVEGILRRIIPGR
ncbi:AsmA family protein [Desulfonatronovibrio hydrogenovorans]|uniref:AsmA family protein n=1 Tax=Desulfonatronovibrio hydrogenovorans TaxID=53245 RepID=UPI0004910047|nr:AsmA family protein [Desulfonatronovibrio hydrogenovorans]